MRRQFAILIRCVAWGCLAPRHWPTIRCATSTFSRKRRHPPSMNSRAKRISRWCFLPTVVAKYQTAGIKGDFTILDGPVAARRSRRWPWRSFCENEAAAR